MTYLNEFLSNFPLMNALIAWFGAQFIKFILAVALMRKFDFKKLIASGGMPSSHSATVCALTVSIALTQGISSVAFAVCFILSFIVMYDAVGVRRSAGEQAKLLNELLIELMESNSITIDKNLKEILGHTPFEVMIGAIFGIVLPFLTKPLFF